MRSTGEPLPPARRRLGWGWWVFFGVLIGVGGLVFAGVTVWVGMELANWNGPSWPYTGAQLVSIVDEVGAPPASSPSSEARRGLTVRMLWARSGPEPSSTPASPFR